MSHNLAVIVLTKNEAIHLERCLNSIVDLADEIVIVDCGSNDATFKIAQHFNTKFIHNPWVNYSSQFKFGVSNVSASCKWIMRLDADEYLTENLRSSVKGFLFNPPEHIHGAYFPRRMAFMGRQINHGGIFPAYMLRLFRLGQGEIEDRWMDEHIKVKGGTIILKGELIDDNLNSLTWWTDKHNQYASREAVDLLNLEFAFMKYDSVASATDGSQSGFKRWLKDKIYFRLHPGFRALAYFSYRYFIRLGFLDAKEGTMFHILQGFWYRYLVDCKVYEVKSYMRTHNVDVRVAIRKILDIQI